MGSAPQQNYTDSEKFVLKALAVDSQSAEAYIMLAVLRGLGQWNWKEAEQAAKRAIELNPGNSEAWDTYRAMYLEPRGRLEEAVAAQKRAMSLDPRNSILALRLAVLYKSLGQCDEAIRQSRINAASDPTVPIHLTVAASCFEQQGKIKEAIAANRQVKSYWMTDALLDALDKAYDKEGEQGYFRVMLAHQKSLVVKRNDAWYFVAVYSAHLKDWESAFQALNRAIDVHDRNVIYLKNETVFAPMRNDPRFKAALKRLNLE
jgi:tetratricopeptide (TPR) repeat protein